MNRILKYVIITLMKILFITDLYPIQADESTTPVTLHNFVREWIKQGHEVKVLKPNWLLNSFLRNKPFYNTGFYELDGVKIFNANYLSPFWYNFLDKIPKEVKFDKYDFVVAHMPIGIIFANKLTKLMRMPMACAVHCSDLEVLTNPAYTYYFREQMEDAYRRAKKIPCRSMVLQDKFSSLFPKYGQKSFFAPSGLISVGTTQSQTPASSSLFSFSSPSLPNQPVPSPFANSASHQPKAPESVLTCANLIKRKNVDQLILALKDTDFKLKIIGDGAELSTLQAMKTDNVEFLGRLPHEQVLKEMQKANIFVLPSVNETFGMVYLEAMAAGCITVCTKGDGVDGIIQDCVNGFLTEPTAEGIKEVLLKIKNSKYPEQIRTNAAETIKEYTIEKCAKKYIDELEQFFKQP